VQIENIELLQLFMESVCDAVALNPSVMPDSVCSSMAELLKGNATLMQAVARHYENIGEPGLARVTQQIENALQDANLLVSKADETPGRLLDYVYPVV